MNKSITGIPKRLKKKIRLYLHRGNKYECPFCGFRSKDLKPFGQNIQVLKDKQVVGAGLRNGKCYKCNSTDRERLIFTFLKEKLNLFGGNKKLNILHMAPEKRLSSLLLKAGFENYICGDLFAEGYKYPDHVQNINVLDLPFQTDFFDLVICNHVLEHIPNDKDAMKEILRVSKKGAKSILQVPISRNTYATHEDFTITDPEKREKIFGQFDHVRIYGQDYIGRLESVGFKVSTLNISKEFSKFGLNEYEDIFIGEKYTD